MTETHVLALQQISDHVATLAQRLESIAERVEDVRERLVRLEAQETGRLLDGLRAEMKAILSRVDALESQRDQAFGVAAFGAWIARTGPWLAAAAGAFLAGVGFRGDGAK